MRDNTHAHRRRSSSGFIFGLVALAALAAFLLLNGHGYHLLAYAPLLILLACPLIHMFGHGGHGAHGGHAGHGDNERPESPGSSGSATP